MNSLVSIIIPVYNTAPFLRRCLDSVLTQTYKIIEVILIDDGSTDGSTLICDEYKIMDHRVSVIHQKNLGAAAARNTGLDNAQGDYIMFCDSDDVVSPNWVSHMVQLLSDEQRINMPICDYCCNIADLESNNAGPLKRVTKGLVVQENMFSKIGFLWNTIFFRDIIQSNSIVFRSQKEKSDFNEDLLFVMDYLRHIDNVVFTGYTDYAYLTREESLSRSHNKFDFEKYAEKYDAWMAYAKEYGSISDYSIVAEYYIFAFINSLYDNLKRYKIFKQIIESNQLQSCVSNSCCTKENPIVIKLIRNKNTFALWLYLLISSFKNKNTKGD